jgi:leucyl-tRNA synthetase
VIGDDGRLIESGQFGGMPADDGRTAIIRWLESTGAGKGQVQYKLHDWCISRQRYWGPPIPIIHCDDCGPVAVPERDLPVVLPEIEDFRPDDTGISPLARHEEWYFVPCPHCGKRARRETDVSDTFLDSAWYYLRYPSTDFADRPFDAERTRRWCPVATYIGGNEHAVLHLLYSRYIAMVVPPLPRARPHREGRGQDVEVAGQHRRPRRVHRPVGRGHLPHLPDVPRAVPGGRRLP